MLTGSDAAAACAAGQQHTTGTLRNSGARRRRRTGRARSSCPPHFTCAAHRPRPTRPGPSTLGNSGRDAAKARARLQCPRTYSSARSSAKPGAGARAKKQKKHARRPSQREETRKRRTTAALVWMAVDAHPTNAWSLDKRHKGGFLGTPTRRRRWAVPPATIRGGGHPLRGQRPMHEGPRQLVLQRRLGLQRSRQVVVERWLTRLRRRQRSRQVVLQPGLGRQRHRGRHNGHVHMDGWGGNSGVGGGSRRHAGRYKAAAARGPAVVGVNWPPHQRGRIAAAACPRHGHGRHWLRWPHPSQQDLEVLRVPPGERATAAIVVAASRPG